MKEALLVAAGGAAGALLRYFMVLLFARFHVSSLFAIWVVNVSGSFALGLLLSLALSRTAIPQSMQLLAGVGFLGSYTTFSTLMWDTFSLSDRLCAHGIAELGSELYHWAGCCIARISGRQSLVATKAG